MACRLWLSIVAVAVHCGCSYPSWLWLSIVAVAVHCHGGCSCGLLILAGPCDLHTVACPVWRRIVARIKWLIVVAC